MKRILWFRRDLRIDDNPLLSQEGEVLPIFIFDTHILSKLPSNDKRVSFIFNAVMSLKHNLKSIGLDLAIFYGDPTDIFTYIISKHLFHEVCASGDYDEYALSRDRDISHLLPFNYLNDTYIFKPDEVLKHDSTPYLVFTPYYNRAKEVFNSSHMINHEPKKQIPLPFDFSDLIIVNSKNIISAKLDIESIGFTPQKLNDTYQTSPIIKLEYFQKKLDHYNDTRDYMSMNMTSSLSTDLRFGTISIRIILRWLTKQKKAGVNTEPFFRQLIFREFYAMLLYHFPYLSQQNFRYPFHGIENQSYFEAFCTARTGFPIIDAGITELLTTGTMHNRVRMICASFFTKNLLLPWQWGEAFFAQYLMDFDASSNILSWQWSAGTGVDPQPYFRIFNPYTQTKKFDKNHDYITKFLPKDYNLSPIVDHKMSSQKALDYFKSSLL